MYNCAIVSYFSLVHLISTQLLAMASLAFCMDLLQHLVSYGACDHLQLSVALLQMQ